MGSPCGGDVSHEEVEIEETDVSCGGRKVEEEISTMATQYWAEGVRTGKWSYEQKEAWMMQIREVQTWKQVRGTAGAVMCETRDLGTKRPYWHTLIFSNDTKIECTGRSSAKHEYEELTEGAWHEPALALLRKKAKGVWAGQEDVFGSRLTQKKAIRH